jgi:hypothetical protein
MSAFTTLFIFSLIFLLVSISSARQLRERVPKATAQISTKAAQESTASAADTPICGCPSSNSEPSSGTVTGAIDVGVGIGLGLNLIDDDNASA